MPDSLFNRPGRPQRIPVYVNVYDLVEDSSYLVSAGNLVGVGIYHSGIEVMDKEFCFGGHDYAGITGVFQCKAREGPPNAKYKTTIMQGFTTMSSDEIGATLKRISKSYTGPSYNLLKRNCNTFTNEAAVALTGKNIPSWINRAATLGLWMPCFVPQEWVEPPDAQEAVEQVVNANRPTSPIGRPYETMPYQTTVEQPLPPGK